MKKLIFTSVALLLLVLISSSEAGATTMNFTGSATVGNSTIAANEIWTINGGVTLTVAACATIINLGTIIVDGGPGVDGGGVLDNLGAIDNKGSIIVNGGVDGAGGGLIINRGSGTCPAKIFTNNSVGTITLNDGAGSGASGAGTIDNTGKMENKGTMILNGIANFCNNIAGGGELSNNGIFTNLGAGTINNNGGTINNSNTFKATSNSTINNLGTFINSSGTFTNTAGTMFNNFGAVVAFGGTFTTLVVTPPIFNQLSNNGQDDAVIELGGDVVPDAILKPC